VDPLWQTLLNTPSFPEYPSAHSVQSAAAAEVLTALLGAVPFVDSTHVALGHAPRRFESFHAAAREAQISRLYGGIHYPMAIDNGALQGQCVGRAVLRRVHTRRDEAP
jgi:membrane-associated phospholipid phosphatase